MADYTLPKINTAYIFYGCLVSQADTKLFKSAPTLAAGDFKVSTDGGAFANLATLPTNTPGTFAVKFSLSAGEMNGGNILVVANDVAGAEWCDQAWNIQTSAVGIEDIYSKVDTEIADIKTKTDNLPTDPADASDIASSFSTVNSTLAAIAAYIDTEVAAIKAKTDQLTFTVANRINATILGATSDGAKSVNPAYLYTGTISTVNSQTSVAFGSPDLFQGAGCLANTFLIFSDGVNFSVALITDSQSANDICTLTLLSHGSTVIAVGQTFWIVAASPSIDSVSVAAIKAKTDGLPSDPADASDVASSFSTVNSTLSTIAGYIDTEINAIKAKTDQLTFTVANQVDANAKALSDDTAAADNAEKFFDGTGYGPLILKTTVSSVNSQTSLELTNGSNAVSNAYKGCIVVIRSHTTYENVMFALCTAYDEGANTITIDSTSGATFTIVAGNLVEILPPGFVQDDRTSDATIKAKTDNLPSDPADQSLIIAATDAIKGDTAAVKVQTDKLAFTVANQVDSNIQSVNDVSVTGNGAGTPWGPA